MSVAETLALAGSCKNARVGWAVKPIDRSLRWASMPFSPSYYSIRRVGSCRVDKRSASTTAALNPVDARCLSTLPPSTNGFATIQDFLTVHPMTIEDILVVRVGWIEQLRLEKHDSETQRQGLAVPGFMAFNPAYVCLREASR